jgi:hypothetical protein
MMVDWFDFWLNGHEDPDPEKADQYRRWRGLCSAFNSGQETIDDDETRTQGLTEAVRFWPKATIR